MGYMRHHTIVVTSWDDELAITAHAQAEEVFTETACVVSALTPPATNGFRSFFVAPDGSKEGWTASNEGDEARSVFVEWMDSQRYSDGSTSLDWVEVQFGDDDGETVVISDSDDWRRP